MRKSKLAIILLLLTLNFCETTDRFKKIGSFNQLAIKEIDSGSLVIDKKINKFEKCYFIGKYRYNENFVTENLDKLADGDTTIIGFRELTIEYTEYGVPSYLGPVGIYCVTYTGYAIRKKEIK